MRRAVPTILILLVTVAAGALEVSRGDIRLTLHENSARFSIDLLIDGEWVSLLYPDDPRTSALDVREDNRVHRMGDSGRFRQFVVQREEEVGFVWTSATLRVEQLFRFTRGRTANRTDALQVVVTVTNTGEHALSTAVRLLLDTYLGERSNVHFATPTTPRFNREARLDPGPGVPYVTSTPDAGSGYGLQLMLFGEGVTPAEEAVLANWKRLTDSAWGYAADENRNFNRLPYSINDSAILVLYTDERIEPGQSYSVVTYLGNLSSEGYLTPEAAALAPEHDRLLVRLTQIVARINALLDEADVDPVEVERLQAELDAISSQVRGR